jgi:hypothetical protein
VKKIQRKQKNAVGGRNLKFTICFMEITRELLHLDTKFGRVKVDGHAYKCDLNDCCLWWSF